MRLTEHQRLGVVAGCVALALLLANWQIIGYERIVRGGETVFLDLQPRDPRSLLQGDFVALQYALAVNANAVVPEDMSRGYLVISTNRHGVAQLVDVYQGQALAEGEHRIAFRRGPDGVQIASDAWFFQEGLDRHFQRARYAELRLSSDGRSVLVDLRDGQMQSLGGEGLED